MANLIGGNGVDAAAEGYQLNKLGVFMLYGIFSGTDTGGNDRSID